MKITRIAAYRVELPLHEGSYNWSGGKSVSVFDSTIVRVETDTGLVGHGEVCPLGPFYLPAYADGVRAGIAELGPHLIGEDPPELGQAQPPDGRRAQGASLRQVGHRHRLLGHPRPGRRACRSACCWAAATATTSCSTAPSRRSRPRPWPEGRRLSGRGLPPVPAQGGRRSRTRHRPHPRRRRRARSRATAWSPTPTPAGSCTRPCAWCGRCATSTSTSSSPA